MLFFLLFFLIPSSYSANSEGILDALNTLNATLSKMIGSQSLGNLAKSLQGLTKIVGTGDKPISQSLDEVNQVLNLIDPNIGVLELSMATRKLVEETESHQTELEAIYKKSTSSPEKIQGIHLIADALYIQENNNIKAINGISKILNGTDGQATSVEAGITHTSDALQSLITEGMQAYYRKKGAYSQENSQTSPLSLKDLIDFLVSQIPSSNPYF